MLARRLACLASKRAQSLYEATIPIPESVSVSREGDILTIAGPLGSTRTSLSRLDAQGVAGLCLRPEAQALDICSVSKPFFGTFKTLLENKIVGVTEGYTVYLKIVGIGYRAMLPDPSTLVLKLGYSHDHAYAVPPSLRVFLPDPNTIGLYGLEKNEVTQAAASIRALRPPDAYKGKGIRLADEPHKNKPIKKKDKR